MALMACNKFLVQFAKNAKDSQGVFIAMASKFSFCISDIRSR